MVDFYLTVEWLRLRQLALDLYGSECMNCGSTMRAQVDHVLPRSHFSEFELSISNLQILCEKCNKKKSNIHFTDFRGLFGPAGHPTVVDHYYPLSKRTFNETVGTASELGRRNELDKHYHNERFFAWLISSNSDYLINRYSSRNSITGYRAKQIYVKQLSKGQTYVTDAARRLLLYKGKSIESFFGLEANTLRRTLVNTYGGISIRARAYAYTVESCDQVKEWEVTESVS